MWRVLFALVLIGWAGGASLPVASQPKERPAPLTFDDLWSRDVIGRIGIPLGEAVEIRATVVSGAELHVKSFDGRYLLRVDRVNGQPLPDPPVMEFVVRGFAGVDLATDHFDLYELRHGEQPGSLNSDQIRALENGYVGSEIRIFTYEAGQFRGIPAKLPKEVGAWQDVAFGFRTHLVVIGEPAIE